VWWKNNPPVFDNISKLSTFIETVDEDSRALISSIKDLEPLLDQISPESLRVHMGKFPIYDVELISTVPYRYILWAGYGYYKADGSVIGVRDSHNQLLASPDWEEPVPGLQYRDLFKNVLTKRDTESFSLYFGVNQSRRNKRKELIKSMGIDRVEVYGKSVLRQEFSEAGLADTVVDFSKFLVSPGSFGDEYKITFPLENTLPDVTSRGASFVVSDVEKVYIVERDHQLRALEPDEEIIIGSMSVQSFAVKTAGGEFQVFYFDSVDMLQLNNAGAELKVTAFDYHVRERVTRGSQRYADENGLRTHHNLGVTDKLPEDFMTMRVVNSDTIVFPLWQPAGNLAAFAITEHADYNGIEQDNLTMYGNIEGKFEAGMGLIGNNIPITKTVFPTGSNTFMTIFNAETGESAKIRQSNVEDHEIYRKQLSGYSVHGDVEIGLHCAGRAQRQGKTVEGLTEILADMHRLYNSVTWVDHGGIECLWETGWDPESKSYLLPGLKQSGYKYLNTRDDKFGAKLSLIEDNEAGNILFYVPRFDDDLTDDWKAYNFTTSDFLISEKLLSKQHLEKVIDQRGFQNAHTYLPYQVLTVIDGKPAKADWYEAGLDNLAYYRDKGDIYLATSTDLLDYVLFIRSLDYIGVDGRITIFVPDKAEIIAKQPTFGVVSLVDADINNIKISPNMDLEYKEDNGISYFYPAKK